MSDIQKDLVLSINEYAYVLDRTKGNVSCWVGPAKTSLSTSDELVRFDSKTKKFIPCCSQAEAISLFASAPENWYIALKNPAADGRHPTPGTANTNPEKMSIGCKVNIPGPATFALYPGQMAKIIKGHVLRSNQYLLARVYDANALNGTTGEETCDSNGMEYINGEILVIKGTDVSFYIPPTGIEVIAIHNDDKNGYVRDAVTLERLEYCILKDEDGNKRYVHGPEVVFPEPTESFVADENGKIKYRAIELSEISGVYVKVIADYEDHRTGEELFITGKEQMIYYPRPEHSFITYNDKIKHHAIAIPKGQGRYIMNRMTGEIKTITGPAMYLPDPRYEVVVRRTLSKSECNLIYPGNLEVLKANGYDSTDKSFDSSWTTMDCSLAAASHATYNYAGMRTTTDANEGFSRKNTYTPPRSISFNETKYEGAVSVDVWTGYAVNVISKDGDRKVVRGPQTILLDYDQTLEVLCLSTGKPKTTDRIDKTVFLRHENNRVSDIINVQTSDFVTSQIKVSYMVDFDPSMMDKWFSVDNYIKHLCDWARATVKRAIREVNISELCNNYNDIVRKALKDSDAIEGPNYFHLFRENGMKLMDIEVLSMEVEEEIQAMINEHQEKIVSRTLDLVAAQQSTDVEKEIVELNRKKAEINADYTRFKMEREHELDMYQQDLSMKEEAARDEATKQHKQALCDIQTLEDTIFAAKMERDKAAREAEIAHKEKLAEIEAKREADSANAMTTVLSAIGPDLAAALNCANNQEIVNAIAGSIAPYAVANGESVAEAVDRLLRGSGMEDILAKLRK